MHDRLGQEIIAESAVWLFAKMLLKMKALIRLESLNIAKISNCRIPAESARSAASLGHHFFQLREF